jgi:hypothetical protein
MRRRPDANSVPMTIIGYPLGRREGGGEGLPSSGIISCERFT